MSSYTSDVALGHFSGTSFYKQELLPRILHLFRVLYTQHNFAIPDPFVHYWPDVPNPRTLCSIIERAHEKLKPDQCADVQTIIALIVDAESYQTCTGTEVGRFLARLWSVTRRIMQTLKAQEINGHPIDWASIISKLSPDDSLLTRQTESPVESGTRYSQKTNDEFCAELARRVNEKIAAGPAKAAKSGVEPGVVEIKQDADDDWEKVDLEDVVHDFEMVENEDD